MIYPWNKLQNVISDFHWSCNFSYSLPPKLPSLKEDFHLRKPILRIEPSAKIWADYVSDPHDSAQPRAYLRRRKVVTWVSAALSKIEIDI